MKNLLPAFLRKKGIQSPDELSPEERKTYDTWVSILSTDELVTVDMIKAFCQSQISRIELQWRNTQGTAEPRLIPYHTVYKALIEAIEAPNAQRQSLEKYLVQLIES